MSAFRFVPFGAEAPGEAVCCDGLVDGAALHLSHWPGNRTPQTFKRDTSVEIALSYSASGERAALVANNHFDGDGVLAVFCLLEPDVARAHADLLIAAAEVGDFGAWPSSDRAFWLETAIARLAGGRSDAEAYARVLPELASLCRDLDAREHLWGDAWKALLAEDARAERDLRVTAVGPIAIFEHSPGAPELSTTVLSKRAPKDATRWLRAFAHADGTFEYRYDLVPHAWADTVDRPKLGKPSRNAIVARAPGTWAIKGDLGMVGLARTSAPLAVAPEAVARALLAGDRTATARDTVDP